MSYRLILLDKSMQMIQGELLVVPSYHLHMCTLKVCARFTWYRGIASHNQQVMSKFSRHFRVFFIAVWIYLFLRNHLPSDIELMKYDYYFKIRVIMAGHCQVCVRKCILPAVTGLSADLLAVLFAAYCRNFGDTFMLLRFGRRHWNRFYHPWIGARGSLNV